MSRLASLLLFARVGEGAGSLPAITRFFKEGLRCSVAQMGDSWARIDTGGTPLLVQTVTSESYLTTGFSPVLSFDVADLDAALPSLLSQGAHMDGPIKYSDHGKVATLRAPFGVMLSLYEAHKETQ